MACRLSDANSCAIIWWICLVNVTLTDWGLVMHVFECVAGVCHLLCVRHFVRASMCQKPWLEGSYTFSDELSRGKSSLYDPCTSYYTWPAMIITTRNSHPAMKPASPVLSLVSPDVTVYGVWSIGQAGHQRGRNVTYHFIIYTVHYQGCQPTYNAWLYTWLILGLRPANDRRRYFVTTSLVGLAQT